VRKKLTTVGIAALKAGEYWDQTLPGLILRVGKQRRTWQYRYRAGNAYYRHSLGHFPNVELAEARQAARALVERLDKGAPPSPAPAHPRSSAAHTLGGLIARYQQMREREGNRIKTLPEAMATLRRCLEPWLDLPAAAFCKADLRAARDAVAERGALMMANRLIGYIGPVLQWAAEEDLITHNFAGDIRRSPEVKRKRTLTKAEIPKVWRACGEINGSEVARSFGRMVQFLLVTGQRLDEAASLKHGHIVEGIWLQEQNKADRPHRLVLPKLALTLIGKGERDALVFPGRLDGKISGFSKLKTTLDELSGVSDWRLHDLRRTAASGMQESGVADHIVHRVLNHSVVGLSAVYLQAQLEKEKAAALEAWAAALTRIVRPVRVVA
jgi:integrase